MASRFGAVLFDAYGTLFDVHSVTAAAEQSWPGNGTALAALWRQKQLEYAWLRTLGERYKPFWALTRDALEAAAEQLALKLDTATRERLLNQYACLTAFPDVKPALRALDEAGILLGVLSNGTPDMLEIAIKSAGLGALLDPVISVDAVRAYKPAPAAYALGPERLAKPAREILFVSSNAWDVAGAGWFGYPTFWVNRAGLAGARLDTPPAAEGKTLADLCDFIARAEAGKNRTP